VGTRSQLDGDVTFCDFRRNFWSKSLASWSQRLGWRCFQKTITHHSSPFPLRTPISERLASVQGYLVESVPSQTSKGSKSLETRSTFAVSRRCPSISGTRVFDRSVLMSWSPSQIWMNFFCHRRNLKSYSRILCIWPCETVYRIQGKVNSFPQIGFRIELCSCARSYWRTWNSEVSLFRRNLLKLESNVEIVPSTNVGK